MTAVAEFAVVPTTARWIATVFYRTDSGLVDVTHDLLELEDLHDRVEAGPHWDTVERIEVQRADGAHRALTVEEAQKL